MKQQKPKVEIMYNQATKTTFKFVGVTDTGVDSGACCPHCGADGRYIYHWEEDGKPRAAMAGCYAALTGHLQRDDVSQFDELLAEKVAKNKKLTGWDKRVLGLRKALADGRIKDENWMNTKIAEIVRERKYYMASNYRRW